MNDLAAYAQYLETRKLAPSTIKAYLKDARCFDRWQAAHANKQGKRRKITERGIHTPRLTAYLDSKKLAPRTRNRLLASLSLLLAYREAENPSSDGMQELLLRGHIPKSEPKARLSLAQVKHLREVTHTSSRLPEQVRDTALVAFLYGTGLRAAEVCNLTMEDILPHEVPCSLRIRGRGEDYVLPLSGTAQHALQQWLARRTRLRLHPETQNHLWITLSANHTKRPGDPLDPQGLRAMLEHYGRCAKLEVKVTPSLLRYTFAAELEGAGVDARMVKVLLGINHAWRSSGVPPQVQQTEAIACLPDP